MAASLLGRVLALVRHLPGASSAELYVRRAVFIRDLRRLNDVLATTALANRYFVCGGLLLGWARNGKILLEDADDADFAYLAEDAGAFESAARVLARAGYEPVARFVNNDGQPTEHVFRRHGARFEFFALWHREGLVRYFMYDAGDELVCERAHQDLVPFRFLGRTWLKPAGHEAVLTATYGDWRSSRADWNFADAGTVIARRPATFARQPWNPVAGELSSLPSPK